MNGPIPNHFDAENAALLARISAMAYDPLDWTNIPECLAWRHEIVESPATDTLVVILTDDTDLIAAFRGTATIRNWLMDLDCKFTEEDGCRIHAGFAAALDSLQGTLNSEIFSAGYEQRRIWITGHSLGGALAMLFAWRSVQCHRKQPFSGVYTFGQPRVGDSHFRDSYNFSGLQYRTFRVIHSADIVPHVPCLLGLYRHPWHEIFFDDSREWREDAPLIWKVKGEAAANVHRLTKFRSAELDDHHIDNYVKLFPELNPAPDLNLPSDDSEGGRGIEVRITMRNR